MVNRLSKKEAPKSTRSSSTTRIKSCISNDQDRQQSNRPTSATVKAKSPTLLSSTSRDSTVKSKLTVSASVNRKETQTVKAKCPTSRPSISKDNAAKSKRTASPGPNVKETQASRLRSTAIKKRSPSVDSVDSRSSRRSDTSNSCYNKNTFFDEEKLKERSDKHKMRYALREKLKNEKEETEISKHTFKPVRIAKNSKIEKTIMQQQQQNLQVHERLLKAPELVKEKLDHVKQELDIDLTFKPQISANATKLAQSTSHINHVERLYDRSISKMKTAEVNRAEARERMNDYSFSPELNEKSKELAKSKSKIEDSKNLFERLNSDVTAAYVMKYAGTNNANTSGTRKNMEDLLLKVKNQMEMEECTFEPQINHYI